MKKKGKDRVGLTMAEKPKRTYTVAATFTVERCLSVEAGDAEEAARIAVNTEYLAWGRFAVPTEDLDPYSDLNVETRLDDGSTEETWLSLVEDDEGTITVTGVLKTRVIPAKASEE